MNRRSALLFALLGCLALSAAGARPFCAQAATQRPPILERVAVIGASVTDGFLLPNEVHAMVTVADVLQAASVIPIEAPFRKSSMLFFRDPVEYGTRYAKAARGRNPTLLFAIDFLFWFGYGFTMDEETRLKQLEKGLALLDPFECPVVVGDFPNMLVAAREGVGIHGAPMINEWQVPKKPTLARLNQRLREWAQAKPNVHLVPMAAFLDQIRSGVALEIRGNHWPADSMELLIDKDLLHTTFEGTIALTLLALDSLVQGEPDLEYDLFHWDAKLLRRRIFEARSKERAQRMRKLPESSDH